MSNTQAERVEGLAAQHGTRYVNRHFPDKASYGFTQEELQAFAAALVADADPSEAQLLALAVDHPDTTMLPRQREAALNRGRERYAAFLAARNTTQQQGG